MYQHRRVIFDNIDLSSVTTLSLDVYYGEDVSSECRMHASFVIYDNELGVLTEDDIDIAESDLTFREAPAYYNQLGD